MHEAIDGDCMVKHAREMCGTDQQQPGWSVLLLETIWLRRQTRECSFQMLMLVMLVMMLVMLVMMMMMMMMIA